MSQQPYGAGENQTGPGVSRYSYAATSAVAHCPSVESICPRRTGPATGGSCQLAPNPDAYAKEAPWFYIVSISGSGARREDNPPSLSVGWGCSRAMQGDPRGVPRGERPRRFFGDFLIVEKVTLRSKPRPCGRQYKGIGGPLNEASPFLVHLYHDKPSKFVGCI